MLQFEQIVFYVLIKLSIDCLHLSTYKTDI